MSRLLEFFLGSILITVFTVAFIFFSALQYLLRVGGMADCAWHGSAQTWIDSNGDGLINNSERPLGGIKIHIDDAKNQLVDVGWPATTSKYGEVQLHVTIPGCSNTVFEIYAEIPEGYLVTTQPRIEVTQDFWGSLGAENVYYFGFRSDR